jgi:hypothetical protein
MCCPAAGDRVTRNSFGRRRRRRGGVWFFAFFFTSCSYRLLASRENTGKTLAAAADRVTPGWTAGW